MPEAIYRRITKLALLENHAPFSEGLSLSE
jgi:hypothetical protein